MPTSNNVTPQESGSPAFGQPVYRNQGLRRCPLLDDTLAYFKAYDREGRLSYAVWTSSPATESMERAAFQSRLDRGDLLAVDVAYGDPHRRNETLRAYAPPIDREGARS